MGPPIRPALRGRAGGRPEPPQVSYRCPAMCSGKKSKNGTLENSRLLQIRRLPDSYQKKVGTKKEPHRGNPETHSETIFTARAQGKSPPEARQERNTVQSPVDECYGLPTYQCYTIAQILTPNKQGKVKVIASW